LRSHIKNVGKRPPEQSGKYPVNENDEEEFRRRDVSPASLRVPSSWPGSSRPSTSSLLRTPQDVDARIKSGHDAVFADRQV
jgi:hypothetical protein